MSEPQKKTLIWEYIYMLLITAIIGLLPFLYYKLPSVIMLIFVIFVVAGLIIVWKSKLSKKLLYFNNLLLFIFPACLAYFANCYIIHSMDTIIGVVVGVAVMDVVSFTKRGRNTLNAKASANMNTLARLSVCLPVPKKPGLQPIIGVGDLTYYSVIMIYFINSDGVQAGLIAFSVIFLGQLVNILAIMYVKKKQLFDGFPATLFPGLFIFIGAILHIF